MEKVLGFLKSGPQSTAEIRRTAKKHAADDQKFFNLLSYLKREGLVESRRHPSGTVWRITGRGNEKLKILKDRNAYSAESADYSVEKDGSVKIITYDIPAKERAQKRFWLRTALKRLGFQMLQKSVWMGKAKIPEEFMADLHERRMLGYLQIFEISKRGTIKELT